MREEEQNSAGETCMSCGGGPPPLRGRQEGEDEVGGASGPLWQS